MCFYCLVLPLFAKQSFQKAQYGAKVVKKQKITPPKS